MLASATMKTTLITVAIGAATLLIACNKDSGPAGAASGSPSGASTAMAATTGATAKTGGAAAIVGIKAGETFAASCDTISADSECGEVVAAEGQDKAKQADAVKQLCKKGTFSAEKTCASEKMVGTCRVMKDIINHYYSDGPKAYTAATAKTKCEKDMGHWVQ